MIAIIDAAMFAAASLVAGLFGLALLALAGGGNA
jgi:hypothetical protein